MHQIGSTHLRARSSVSVPPVCTGRADTLRGSLPQAMRGVLVKALARRGAAFAESQRVEEAVQDYSEAVR